jgi:hypothetical protein
MASSTNKCTTFPWVHHCVISSFLMEGPEEMSLKRVACKPRACSVTLTTHWWSGLIYHKNWIIFLNHLTAYIQTSSSPRRLNRKVTFPSWTLAHTEYKMAPWVNLWTGCRPTPTCIWMLSYIIIQSITIMCYHPWHKNLEPSVTRSASCSQIDPRSHLVFCMCQCPRRECDHPIQSPWWTGCLDVCC